jgi:type IV secretory pathway TrbL component
MVSKSYSWLSYVSSGLGIVLVLHPLFTNIFPGYFMSIQSAGILLTILFSILALRKKNEKKLLPFIGLLFGIMMMCYVGVLFYITFNKYSPI